MSKVDYNPWHPITDPVALKHLGKLGEELGECGECGAAVARCMIQGLDGREPVTEKLNSAWLMEEIADVIGNAELVIEHFRLDPHLIRARAEIKKERLRTWHAMA